jgi:hypothetical protein
LAIEATPRGNLEDSLKQHRPLDGVASVPPGGMTVGSSEPMAYQEENLLHNLGRWEGVIDYYPDDARGRGVEHYRDLNAQANKRNDGYELVSQDGKAETSAYVRTDHADPGHTDPGRSRSTSGGNELLNGLKKRLGHHRQRI